MSELSKRDKELLKQSKESFENKEKLEKHLIEFQLFLLEITKKSYTENRLNLTPKEFEAFKKTEEYKRIIMEIDERREKLLGELNGRR